MTITESYICSVNSYCEKPDNNGRSICSTNSDVTITGRFIGSAYSYCDYNGEANVQCLQLLRQ